MKQELGYYELKDMWKDGHKFSKLESLLGVHNSEWFQTYNEYLEHVAKKCTIGKIIEMIKFIDNDLIKCIFKTPDNKEWCCCTSDDYEGYTRSHVELIDELWSILYELL
jgi:hypothetical protein